MAGTMLTEPERLAAERVRKWNQLPDDAELPEFVSIYRTYDPMRGISGMAEAEEGHNRDVHTLAAALVRLLPLLDAMGPVVEECQHVIGELVGPWDETGRVPLGNLPKSKLQLRHVRALASLATPKEGT